MALWVLTNSWLSLTGWNRTMIPCDVDVFLGWAVGSAVASSFVAQRSATGEVGIKVDAIVCKLETLRNVWRWWIVSFVSVGLVIIPPSVVRGKPIVDVENRVGMIDCELEMHKVELTWGKDVWFRRNDKKLRERHPVGVFAVVPIFELGTLGGKFVSSKVLWSNFEVFVISDFSTHGLERLTSGNREVRWTDFKVYWDFKEIVTLVVSVLCNSFNSLEVVSHDGSTCRVRRDTRVESEAALTHAVAHVVAGAGTLSMMTEYSVLVVIGTLKCGVLFRITPWPDTLEVEAVLPALFVERP